MVEPREEEKKLDEQLTTFTEDLTTEELEILKSGKAWEELRLDDALIKALNASNFIFPSKIQEQSITEVKKAEHDVIVVNARNGSGKTLSYLLPVIDGILGLADRTTTGENSYFPKALILVPSIELARQVNYVAKKITKKIVEFDPAKDIKITLITSQYYEEIESNSGQLCIATPGCIVNAIGRRPSPTSFKMRLSGLRFLVLDEADNVLEIKKSGKASLREQSEAIIFDEILENRRGKKPPEVIQLTSLYVSATFDQRFHTYISARCEEFNLSIKDVITEDHAGYVNLKHFYLMVDDGSKKNHTLSEILKHVLSDQAVVFFNYKEEAAKMKEILEREGLSVRYLGGDMDVTDRKTVLNEFMNGKFSILLTTNVIARGVDNRNVELVINRDIPTDEERKPDFDTYMHRCGRAGRFGDRGIVINFVDSRSEPLLKTIQKEFKFQLIALNSIADITNELAEAKANTDRNRDRLQQQ
eukprot:TRINITY_DN732_c0_g1_i1.p1 TRINITY_DN732_c0_g1~~TRINITY_DN732_c0_g1_i1.p1  ORF type:complete len:474 (+),score=152.30 TRINITY_DN732_c0_g1_i1:118-1539(+)